MRKGQRAVKGQKAGRKIWYSVAIFLLTAAVFTAASLMILNGVNHLKTEETKQYLDEVSVQSINTIKTRIQGELQTLEGMAVFIDGRLDREEIMHKLEEENYRNSFIRMGFVGLDYVGDIVDISGRRYTGQDVSDEDFVRQAMAGASVVSSVRPDRFGDGRIICYATPVYSGGNLLGVLTATNTLDSFTAVISGPLFQGVGTNLLIEETGQLILTSNEGPNVTNNFLEYNRFDEDAETALRAHIAAKEQYSFSFLHEGQDYYGTINYAGYNDWYLIGVVPSASLNEGFQTMVSVFFITVAVLVCLFTFLLLRINHITFKNRESIDRLAYYDELTGCYNVNKFRLEAEPLLAADSDYAFVILDLHDFKFINASFGFETGDRLLCHMKAVLAAHLTEGELYYRRYADQFGFLLHTSDPDEITRRLETIMDAVSAFEIAPGDHYPIYCHCGVKIVRMFSDKLDLDQVQDRASIALKKVRDLHGNLCAFYDEALFTRAQRKSDIEKRMNGALQNRDFIAYIQPKYDLNTGKVCGGEALARWRRDGLLVPPGDFIPVFEENGFVVKLDLYMLETVCRLQESWREQGYPILPLSVNQSRLLFYQESYLDVLRRMVKQYGVTPGSIILEVTESIAVEDIDRIASIIVRLHEIGFSVSMDDFGSGYSSLNMLKELAIDELKLDQGFLARTGYEEKSVVIMRSVIRLAQELHMHTVCEGVETEAQVAMLRSLGCDMVQGFYYAKPMDAGRFARLAYKK